MARRAELISGPERQEQQQAPVERWPGEAPGTEARQCEGAKAGWPEGLQGKDTVPFRRARPCREPFPLRLQPLRPRAGRGDVGRGRDALRSGPSGTVPLVVVDHIVHCRACPHCQPETGAPFPWGVTAPARPEPDGACGLSRRMPTDSGEAPAGPLRCHPPVHRKHACES